MKSIDITHSNFEKDDASSHQSRDINDKSTDYHRKIEKNSRKIKKEIDEKRTIRHHLRRDRNKKCNHCVIITSFDRHRVVIDSKFLRELRNHDLYQRKKRNEKNHENNYEKYREQD